MPEISTKAKYDIEYAKINLNVFLLMSKRKNTKKIKAAATAAGEVRKRLYQKAVDQRMERDNA